MTSKLERHRIHTYSGRFFYTIVCIGIYIHTYVYYGMNQTKSVRTVEQICAKTDELLQKAREMNEIDNTQTQRFIGMIEALQWVRRMEDSEI